MKISFWHPANLISTCFGIGKFPIAPGTIGSLIAFPIYFICLIIVLNIFKGSYTINSFEVTNYLLLITTILFFIGSWASSEYMNITNKDDPKEIIIDEVVGQLLTLILSMFLVPTIIGYYPSMSKYGLRPFQIILIILFLSFLFFRIFDILKPWPIRLIDKNVKGGFGVMFDDVAAAFFSIIMNYALIYMMLDFL